MAHYKIILAYDGTEFLGFQRQAEGRTVQGTVESALRRVGWKGSSIQAAGRTDSGVHAAGQVAGFEITWNHSDENLRDALNANLPEDVAIRIVEKVSNDFHPRFSATARCYQYRLIFDQSRDPIRERFAWRLTTPLEMDALEIAAEKIIGKHNFSAFGTPHQPGGSTIREIFSTSWQKENGHLVFEILGNAFLYHMVRRLVSFQIEIGRGKHPPESLDELLSEEQETMVQGLAPAKGLFLKEVRYPE
jgi:tRNA pseudouridine38-40 synthase